MLGRRAFLTTMAAAAQGRRQPNLLFLCTDQWRAQTLPSAGDPNLIAPHLKRLASESVDFRRAYTTYPVCCPSRAAMLTGRFPHAAGVTRNHSLLPLSQNTMSAELKRAGYRTGYIGKWHLDGREGSGFVPPERRRGFDFWAAHDIQHRHFGSVYFRDSPEPIPAPGFEPDHQTDLALEFLRTRSEQPFFLYLSWVAPHGPFTPPPRHDVYDPAKLRLRPNVPESSAAEARKNGAGYYGLCSAVDENVGRLLAELDRLGKRDDTIVVFTADHGYTLGSHGLDAIDAPFEEAAGIPLILRYPARVKPRPEAAVPVSNVDYAPTLLSLCGITPPASMQGVDLSRWLTSGRGAPRRPVFAEGSLGSAEEWRMVIRGFDKLAVDGKFQPAHQYDLSRDPYEMRNLAAEPSARRTREELLALLRRWTRETASADSGVAPPGVG